MTQSRTHTCGELRISDAGKAVTIVGWLENVREVGGELAFAVIRDFYGTTQVVAETEEMVKTLKAINKESTISVTGSVRERASKNSKIPTGDIEIVPESIEVLGRCRHNELPFPINRSREADELTRLKYRYLDLRNPDVKKNIILRCQVVSALRQACLLYTSFSSTGSGISAAGAETSSSWRSASSAASMRGRSHRSSPAKDRGGTMPWWRKSAKYSSAASPSPRSSRRRRAAPDTVTLSSPIGLKIPATRFAPFSCANLGRQSGASFLTFPIVYDLAASRCV